MFKLDSDGSTLHLTRGDRGTMKVKVKNAISGEYYTFPSGCTVSFVVVDKNGYTLGDVLRKTVTVPTDTEEVEITLTDADTKIGDMINKKQKYWYNVVVNDDLTVMGSDEDGEKILILYPEVGEED